MTLIRDFLEDLDGRWGPPTGAKIPLRIIGSSALMLQTGYERGTKASDVLETAFPPMRVSARFRGAVDVFLGDARAADLPRYWRNLNILERDFLRVPETEVDLPEYIDR